MDKGEPESFNLEAEVYEMSDIIEDIADICLSNPLSKKEELLSLHEKVYKKMDKLHGFFKKAIDVGTDQIKIGKCLSRLDGINGVILKMIKKIEYIEKLIQEKNKEEEENEKEMKKKIEEFSGDETKGSYFG